MKLSYKAILAASLFSVFGLSSCIGDGHDAIILEEGSRTDIPSDSHADPNPDLFGESNAIMPNIQYAMVDENGDAVFRIDMTGIQDRNTHEWIRLYGTDDPKQNVWVEIDNEPKGIKVYNTIDDYNDHNVGIDLVFLVDNSGSMSEEADAIARDIISWSSSLAANGLDIKFACVGYDGAINGAIDFTSAKSLSNYLEEGTGTSRTRGFSGKKAEQLSNVTEKYRTGGDDYNECGMAALRFANDNFTFTRGSNRIYVNFTDEPNQPNGNSGFSVEWLKTGWDTSMGTIHTVFSGGTETSKEYNYLMSDYTGGTVLNTNSSFSNVSLFDLPVTGAMQNSYIIRMTNVKKYMDGNNHNVKITVYTPSVKVEREYLVRFLQED